eukprot:CAMPEP_0119140794 /NCGR_PEP_ID=MMETSP1310-20130426/29866_1 /TAXON_ID=464262 /ORGANISM="Genus nov. species nov., Strain RCC2339" /LENGTH=385 /DNA_ID=CAMNT_0007132183 /DNA_START=126 /DNA_END=1283 /DNA_ORIENTATION=-
MELDISQMAMDTNCTQNAMVYGEQKPMFYEGRGGGKFNITRVPYAEEEGAKEVAAVILSIRSGSSYDELFSKVKQEAPEGRVAVYFVVGKGVDAPLRAVFAKSDGPLGELDVDDRQRGLLRDLRADIGVVEPDCVTINWECSSGFGDDGFRDGEEGASVGLLQSALQRGFFAMFSDFALKALIASWPPAAAGTMLGPCPFRRTLTGASQSLTLSFDPVVLCECPSAQLQRVGELCEKGSCELHAMSGTIGYTLADPAATPAEYKLQVLTLVASADGKDPEESVTINGRTGSLGHVLLTFPDSGGRLLCSAGHWIELSRLDVNAETLVTAVRNQYGGESAQYNELVNALKLSGGDAVAQEAKVNMYAKQYVQSANAGGYKKFSKKG